MADFSRLKDLRFAVTGGAGFIGSNICEWLLKNGAKKVIAADNLATGFEHNVSELTSNPSFTFLKGDITNKDFCKELCSEADMILHQAALGSIPRSINNPEGTHNANVNGFLNMLLAAKDSSVKRFVYASSSSVYGDSPVLPKVEHIIGKPLSPYAVSKRVNELYAEAFNSVYGMEIIGLRYFNIFGPNQNPKGEYAAAIPLFIAALLKGDPIYINGNGEQTRDFTYVDNAISANILSALAPASSANAAVYNVACGTMISLNDLVSKLKKLTGSDSQIIYRDERAGDIQKSLANISLAREKIGFEPLVGIDEGLKKTVEWLKSKS